MSLYTSSRARPRSVYVPGIALVVSGIVVLLVPQVLVVLLASLLISAGIGALLLARGVRRIEREAFEAGADPFAAQTAFEAPRASGPPPRGGPRGRGSHVYVFEL